MNVESRSASIEVECPDCGLAITVPIDLDVVIADGDLAINATPDLSGVWLHSFDKHPGNYDIEPEP